MTGCLDPDVALAFSIGQIEGPQRTVIERHLEHCAHCRDLVSRTHTTQTARPPTADDVVPANGTRVGRYLIEERIATGGQGVVCLARDTMLNRLVTIKLMRPAVGAHRHERLIREARALARLTHSNVVAIHDIGTVEDRVFIAMEYVKGVSLRQWLRSRPRRWREVLDVFVAAGRGLAAAHEAGIVHRDFKPSNVVIGDDGRIKVVDFGIARRTDAPVDEDKTPPPVFGESLTIPGSTPGTPGYMAPEVLGGEPADRAADQYSFSVSLHEALFGKRPSHGSITDHGDVPLELRSVVSRGLAADPADRFPSMAVMLAELQRILRPAHARQLVLGLPPTGGVSRARRHADALISHLNERVGLSIRASFGADYRALADDLAAGRVDIAWLPPLSFVWASTQGVQLLLGTRRPGRPDYYGALFARSDSNIECLSDLENKRVGWVDEESAAGYVFPKALLGSITDDVDSFLGPQRFLGSHLAVAEAVLHGGVDVGATFLNLDDAGNVVLSGWLQYLAGEPAQMRLIARTPAIPGGDVIVNRAGLSEEDRVTVSSSFRRMFEEPTGRRLLQAVFNGIEGFERPDPAAFDLLADTARSLGRPVKRR